MNELYNALDHELDTLSPLEAKAFLMELNIDIPAPLTDEELYEWIDFLSYIREKVQKVDNLFIVFEN